MTDDGLPCGGDLDLRDEVAVVTGGTRGIGRAVAGRLAAAGATTVATYHDDEAAAEATADELSAADAPTAVRRFDVGDADAVRDAFEVLHERFGVPTVLVNNAGIMRNGPLVRLDDEDWAAVLRTNLTGAFNCTRTAARWMLRADGGAIVNVSSVAALRGWPGQANYAASKAGLLGLTRSAARELGGRDVRVNAVCPGYVRTDLYEEFADGTETPDPEGVPQERAADPGEVADAVVFLASDAASYINGAALRIDGGRLA